MKKRALVIGSGGQVARGLRAALAGREILQTSSSGQPGCLALDLGRAESVSDAFAEVAERFGRGGVEVFLAGAATNVDRCESERAWCESVNAVGPGLVAQACHDLGYGLTYFSSEYVFGQAEYEGGPVGPFSEMDPPAPTSFYGACKLEGERRVRAALGEAALIARTTMVFSWEAKGLNFLMQYLRHGEAVLNGDAKIFRIPEDQISTPAYAPALAEAVVRLRDQGRGGIINLVGPDLLSRKELVQKVLAAFGLSQAQKGFHFLRTKELGQAARRPLTAGLSSQLAREWGVALPSLDEAFADVKRLRAAEANGV